MRMLVSHEQWRLVRETYRIVKVVPYEIPTPTLRIDHHQRNRGSGVVAKHTLVGSCYPLSKYSS